MSFCLTIHLSFCLYVHLSFCLTVHLSFCVNAHLSFCLTFHLSFSVNAHVSFCLNVQLSFCLTVHLSFYLNVHVSFCLTIHLSFCLSVCLTLARVPTWTRSQSRCFPKRCGTRRPTTKSKIFQRSQDLEERSTENKTKIHFHFSLFSFSLKKTFLAFSDILYGLIFNRFCAK